MSGPRDEALRPSAARERVQELAHAHGFDGDADAQQAIYAALLAHAGEERDALIATLVDEYADCLAHRGVWRRSRYHAPGEHERIFEQGARAALLHVAARLGVSDLHEQAVARAARGEGEQP